ncbi:MAG: hypothetical protein JXR40_10385 [Pontiellaceae bacterium]|nr:hypothetical protein [Pontiellaceae bacterium]
MINSAKFAHLAHRIGLWMMLIGLAGLLFIRFILPHFIDSSTVANTESIQAFTIRWVGIGSYFTEVMVLGLILRIVGRMSLKKNAKKTVTQE